MNPKTFKHRRFNSYITEYQKELLDRISREEHRPITDLVREAIHCWLRDRDLDDELIYDQKDHEKWLKEMFPRWKEEKSIELKETRRTILEQMIRKYPEFSVNKSHSLLSHGRFNKPFGYFLTSKSSGMRESSFFAFFTFYYVYEPKIHNCPFQFIHHRVSERTSEQTFSRKKLPKNRTAS